MEGGIMDFYNILLAKKLTGSSGSGEIDEADLDKIYFLLDQKITQEDLEQYVNLSIQNLPVLTEEDIINLTL